MSQVTDCEATKQATALQTIAHAADWCRPSIALLLVASLSFLQQNDGIHQHH